jgi:hypothetical protein
MPLHGFLATPGVTKKKESVHEQHRDQTAPPDRHDRSDQRIPLGAVELSHDFLSRMPEHLVVTRADGLGWSDWGTPEAIERSFAAMGVVPPWSGRVEAA